jgi:site-specific DNA recombinase
MTRAIGYVRRSTDKQDESLGQQRAKLEAFAKVRGWDLVVVHCDDAISGSEMHRPGLDALVSDAVTRDDVDIVLAWDRNRLARPKDALDGMLLERKLMEAGKRVIYAATGQEADRSFTSGLISYVEHHQYGDYLRKLSRDTMRGLVARAERGMWPGGPIPFGYDRLILGEASKPLRIIRDLDDGGQAIIQPDTGVVLETLSNGQRHKKQDHESVTLIPSEPGRVRALRKMFADFAAGKPSRVLRDELNAAGFRTSRGSRFTVQTILPILENPAYLGRCVYNRRTLSKWHRHTSGQSVERHDGGVEKRPASDWITHENAWPALVDADTFDQVQARRKACRERTTHYRGTAMKADYLLTGLFFCGVCGGKMTGQTCTSGKGYKTRYYVCGRHSAGHKHECPKRYTVPAQVVEDHLLTVIRQDLAKLRDDDKLHAYVAAELQRVTGGKSDARDQLQRRLADLDQQTAKLRDHLLALDPDTAKSLGLYDHAQAVGIERAQVEAELSVMRGDAPALPPVNVIRQRAAAEFDRIEHVLAAGTVEEKRDLVAAYVQTIKADPDRQSVRISLYPTLLSQKIAGAGFEPATSGL